MPLEYLKKHNFFDLLPGGQMHSYENGFGCLQVPPFWQGDGEQGIYFDSQLLPVYPAWHIHLK